MAKATASQIAAEDERCRPRKPEQDADIGRDALAAAEAEPDRKQMAEKGAKAGEHGGVRARNALPVSTAAVPFSASSSSVSAARPLLPVRNTLVAPILPEPIWRRSPRPASLVRIRPNGMEPSR